jgi:cyclopropane fatty-acyl-phospholipid synthase-like methyltransferase
MRGTDTAVQWERYGQRDPYYGVLSHEEFRTENLTPEAVERFYATGRRHVDALAEQVQELYGHPLAPERSLDFGCGLGRILVPLAERSTTAVGVDVAPTTLRRCEQAMEQRGVENVRLIHTDDLGALGADFDFVHSSLVFQHIPPRAGYRLIGQLLRLLAPGGIAVIHVTTEASEPLSAVFFWTLRTIPMAANVWNLIRGRAWSYPHMNLYPYSVSRVAQIAQAAGIPDAHVAFHQAATRPDLNSVTVTLRRPAGS